MKRDTVHITFGRLCYSTMRISIVNFFPCSVNASRKQRKAGEPTGHEAKKEETREELYEAVVI